MSEIRYDFSYAAVTKETGEMLRYFGCWLLFYVIDYYRLFVVENKNVTVVDIVNVIIKKKM